MYHFCSHEFSLASKTLKCGRTILSFPVHKFETCVYGFETCSHGFETCVHGFEMCAHNSGNYSDYPILGYTQFSQPSNRTCNIRENLEDHTCLIGL